MKIKTALLLTLLMMTAILSAFANVHSDNSEILEKIVVIPNSPPALQVSITPDRGEWGKYFYGEKISFTVNTTQNAYIAVIGINLYGQLALLMPNDYDSNNYLYSSGILYLPRKGYSYQIDTQKSGTEHVLVLASRRRNDLINYVVSQIQSGSVSDYSGLGNLLRNIVPNAVSDWAQDVTSYYCGINDPSPGLVSRIVILAVGISRYPSSPLPSPAKDAQDFVNLMKTKYGIKNSDVVLLTDSNATKNAIENALSSMKSRLDKNTTLIFFFSGHGSQIKDDNGDESDGKDEVICPVDFDIYNPRETSIVDDQLSIYIKTLASYAKDVVFIFDSCFSGGAQKSLTMKSGGIFSYTEKGFSTGLSGAEEGKEAFDISSLSNFCFLGASKGNETSKDTYDDFGHSLYTNFLLQGMEGPADTNNDGKITTIEIFNYITEQIEKVSEQFGKYLQTPVIDPSNSIIIGN